MNEKELIKSPLTNESVKLVLEIDKRELIERYQQELNISIDGILVNCDINIKLFECEETGFRFFYPYNIAGDGSFYEKLEGFPWYYAQWKWDYEEAAKYINDNSSVLDIGCGEGKFLSYLAADKNCVVRGLELNHKAKSIAEQNGIDVKNELIQDHAEAHEEKYDVVCFFQVLEHISEVDSFLKSAIKCCKKGGKIIIAVPNNDPYYLTFDKFHLLNLPPHHMNWWNSKSLTAISQTYNIEIEKIIIQPLEHYKGYTVNYLKNKFPSSGLAQSLFYMPFKMWFYLNRNNINGASIMAVYNKK